MCSSAPSANSGVLECSECWHRTSRKVARVINVADTGKGLIGKKGRQALGFPDKYLSPTEALWSLTLVKFDSSERIFFNKQWGQVNVNLAPVIDIWWFWSGELLDGHGSPDLVIEVIWRAWWQPKPPLSCEIRGNGEPSCISTNFIKELEKKDANWFPDPHIFPLLTENLALLVREGNPRRKERTTPRYRSVFFIHISFFFCHHSVAKNFSYQNSLFVPPAFQTSLYVRLSLSTFISIDLLRKHVTFLIGQFNGNRVPMKNLELADCHSASPYIPPSNGKSTLNGK